MSGLAMTSEEAEQILGPGVSALARSIVVPPRDQPEVDLLLLLLAAELPENSKEPQA
jgi:hypothetical protein